MHGKTTEYFKVKDLNPNVKEGIRLKGIVLEKNVPENGSNANVLVADDTGCVNVVLLPKVAAAVHHGDIVRLQNISVVMRGGNRLSIKADHIERIGEFCMLFKENFNVSRLNWAKNEANQWVRNSILKLYHDVTTGRWLTRRVKEVNSMMYSILVWIFCSFWPFLVFRLPFFAFSFQPFHSLQRPQQSSYSSYSCLALLLLR